MRAHLITALRRPGASAAVKLIYLLTVTAILAGAFAGWAYDDTFITYRYAQNLARGAGFVYNPGEYIQSTTTPLFTILLALLQPISSDLPHLAILIGSFSLALGAWFLWELSQAWHAPIAGAAALLLVPAFPLLLNTLGSETPLYLALCLGAFAFYARGKYLPCAVCAALAVLARVDGMLVPLILAIHYVARPPSRDGSQPRPVAIPWHAVALFIGITAAWFVFAWLYFGTPLPATLFAKQRQGAMSISQQFAPGLLMLAQHYLAQPHYWILAALALAGVARALRSARQWLILLAWTALYVVVYSILGVSRYFWYFAPIVPGFVACVGLGVQAAVEWVGKASGILRKPRLAVLAASILIGASALVQAYGVAQLRQDVDRRAPIYRAIGEWLEANTDPNSTVGTLEVGIIGYYAHRRMIDFAGLIQPDVAAQLRQDSTYEDAAAWAIDRYQPQYLVLLDGALPRTERYAAAQHCTMTQHFAGAPYGYNGNLTVYACR